jgi:hypothetical protein
MPLIVVAYTVDENSRVSNVKLNSLTFREGML